MERSKRRMPCSVHVDGRQHNGIVLDLSGSGLFIQTSAKLTSGQRVDIDVSLDDVRARMTIEVVRRKQVPAQLLTVAQGGVGVRIITAPEAYYRFLQDLQEKERQAREQAAGDSGAGRTPAPPRAAPKPAAAAKPAAARPAPAPPPPPPPARPKTSFRVRVSQTSGARSRIVMVGADDADQAGRLALKELGDGWKILGVERA
jgi:hypothetical protein